MSFSSNHGNNQDNDIEMSEINMTPLVDVMLVLLIIFMVTSPMLVAGINVDLPETSANPVSGQDKPLSLSVDKKGDVYLSEVKVPLMQVVKKLESVTKGKRDVRVFVRGDRDVDYGKIMQVVGMINAAGFTKVALVTEVVKR